MRRFLLVTLWKCSTRWFWRYISSIPFQMFKLSLSKVFWCMQLMLGVYLFQWIVHREPSLWIWCVCENTHRNPWGWWYTISPQNTGSVLVKILKVSKHCLRIKTWYRSLLTSATFCQCVQLQPAINITIIPLSWAYGCHLKGHARSLNRIWSQNCNKWLRNSIIYSTSCETNNSTPSTTWCHWLLIAYTS